MIFYHIYDFNYKSAKYCGILLPPTCKINYVNIPLIYGNMQHNYVDMQHTFVDMRLLKIMLHVTIILLTVDISILSRTEVHIVMVHVDINKSYVTSMLTHFILRHRGQKRVCHHTYGNKRGNNPRLQKSGVRVGGVSD